jgi:hypothetical protein
MTGIGSPIAGVAHVDADETLVGIGQLSVGERVRSTQRRAAELGVEPPARARLIPLGT